MTINIQKCSNVTVNGHHSHKNCKAVYCIDTGEIYASALDAANANGVTQSPMSSTLTGRTKSCNGKRFCYVSKMMEHLEEITEANRIRAEKVAAYDAEVERRRSVAKAQEKLNQHKANVEELRRKLEEATAVMACAENELHAVQYSA